MDDVGSSIDDVMLRFKDGHAKPGSDISWKRSLQFLSKNAPRNVETDATQAENPEHQNDPPSDKCLNVMSKSIARKDEVNDLEQKENEEPNDSASEYDESEDFGPKAGDVFDVDESKEKLQSDATAEEPSYQELQENDFILQHVTNKKTCKSVQLGRGAANVYGVEESNEKQQNDVTGAKKPSKEELQEIDPIAVPNKNWCELLQHSSSPALEAVKKRSYTTILSRNDVADEIGQVALNNHEKEHASTGNSIEPSALPDLTSRTLEAVKQVSQKDRSEKSFSKAAQVSECITKKVTSSVPAARPITENTANQGETFIFKAVAPIFVAGNTSNTTKEPPKHFKSASANLESTTHERQCIIGPKRSSNPASNAKSVSQKANRRLSYNTEPILSSRRFILAPSNFKQAPTPATAPNVTRTNLSVPQTIQKSISRDLFRGRYKHVTKKKLNYPSLVKSSTKKNEYASDLFGDNESNFGIPTIKTPAARRRSTDSAKKRSSVRRSKSKVIRRSSASGSKPKLASTMLIPDKSERRRVSSKSLASKFYTSPVVTPGSKKDTQNDEKDEFRDALSSPVTALSVKDAISPDDGNAFYDTTSVSFEEQVIPLIRSEELHDYSSPHRFHDVYYGLYIQTPRITSTSPSNNALLMKSPERCGAFHDYYYGQNDISADEYSTPIYDQPLHDVYFGHHMHCDQLSLTELTGYPDSSQALHDTYFGQQEILPNDYCAHVKQRRVVSHRKPLPNVQFKLFYVLLVTWSVFQAANQPENTRYQKNYTSSAVFTLVPTNITHTVAEDIEPAVGWFSSWF